MTQEESTLFQVRLNDQGKKYIRKFAAISYTMLVLVIFGAVVVVYWDIKMLLTRASMATAYPEYGRSLYYIAYPYISMAFSVLAVISNIYYLRFPRALLRSIKINDEYGANQSFKLLFRSAMLFLFWLLLNSSTIIWSLLSRGEVIT
ncbi:MAG: hypothetical protein ACHQFX_19200 [Chitinophagales bacterium]